MNGNSSPDININSSQMNGNSTRMNNS